MPWSPLLPVLARVLAVVGATLGLMGAAGGSARAGTYEVRACADAPGGTTNRTWAAPPPPATLVRTDACGGGGALSFTDALYSANTPGQTRAEWAFVAPPGTTITGATLRYHLGIYGSTTFSAYLGTGDGTRLASCTYADVVGYGCSRGSPDFRERFVFTGLHADRLVLGVLCTSDPSGGCGNGTTDHKVWAKLFGATVTLEDTTAPTVSVDGGGAGDLLTTSNVWRRGTLTGTVSTGDVGGGVRDVRLLVDGAPLSAPGASRDAACDDADAVPCHGLDTAPLALDAASLPCGVHSIDVRAGDAAGNVASLSERRAAAIVRTDALPPVPPTAVVAAGRPVPGTEGQEIAATWASPGQGACAPIAAAEYRLVGADDGRVAAAGTLPVAGATESRLLIPAVPAGRYTLAVRLIDAAGNVGAFSTGTAVDTRPPDAPVPLALSTPPSVANGWTATIRPTVGAALPPRASVVGAGWRLCPADPALGGCRRGTSSTPAAGVTIALPAPGRWSLSLWLVDDRGVAGVAAALVLDRPAPPRALTVPRVVGAPLAGASLTCLPGGWANATSTELGWELDGRRLARLVAPRLILSPAFVGHAVRCRVTARGAGGSETRFTTAVIVRRRPPGLLRAVARVDRGTLVLRVRTNVRAPISIRAVGMRVRRPAPRATFVVRLRLPAAARRSRRIIVTIRQASDVRHAAPRPVVLRVLVPPTPRR